MDFYSSNVLAFVAINAALLFRQWKQQNATTSNKIAGEGDSGAVLAAQAVNWQFKRRFLPVYLLVFGADWLQVSNCNNTAPLS
jgi:hypothetical protein